MTNEFMQKEEEIVTQLKNCFDPEIPVNIYDLGLIYNIDIKEDNTVEIEMTLTAPACPAADFILEDVHEKVSMVEGIKGVSVNLVFDPPWDKDMMSEEARLELGFM
jgi:FeS assembly SUF system protein